MHATLFTASNTGTSSSSRCSLGSCVYDSCNLNDNLVVGWFVSADVAVLVGVARLFGAVVPRRRYFRCWNCSINTVACVRARVVPDDYESRWRALVGTTRATTLTHKTTHHHQPVLGTLRQSTPQCIYPHAHNSSPSFPLGRSSQIRPVSPHTAALCIWLPSIHPSSSDFSVRSSKQV